AEARALNALPQGASTTQTFSVQTVDVHGAVGTAVLFPTRRSSDLTPTLAAEAAGTLLDTAGNDAFGALTGTLDGSDRDTGETATQAYQIGRQTPAGDGSTTLAGTYSTLTVQADGSYTFAADAAAIN